MPAEGRRNFFGLFLRAAGAKFLCGFRSPLPPNVCFVHMHKFTFNMDCAHPNLDPNVMMYVWSSTPNLRPPPPHAMKCDGR